jgi:hypothetical protein
MKRLLVLFFSLSTCFSTYSQYKYFNFELPIDHHTGGDVILSASPTVLLYTPNGSQLAGGIKIQIFLSKRFSLDADLMLSRNYVHLSPGLIGVPLGILALSMGGDEDRSLIDFFASLAAIALAIEHVSYHIPMTRQFDISPYVSLLRYKYASEINNNSEPGFINEQFCFTTGVQLNKYFGRFVLAPYAEYSIGYRDKLSGCNFGVYFGICFPTKSQQ